MCSGSCYTRGSFDISSIWQVCYLFYFIPTDGVRANFFSCFCYLIFHDSGFQLKKEVKSQYSLWRQFCSPVAGEFGVPSLHINRNNGFTFQQLLTLCSRCNSFDAENNLQRIAVCNGVVWKPHCIEMHCFHVVIYGIVRFCCVCGSCWLLIVV